MIKKVNDIKIVPDDIKELLYNEEGEYVPIGKNVYEISQFPLNKYFKLLEFIGKYYKYYNEIFSDATNEENLSVAVFLSKLSQKMSDEGLINEFMETLFPEIGEDLEYMTYEQFKYLLGVVYKLNFLSQKAPIKNPTNRAAIERTMAMLGLQNLQLNI